MPHLVALGGPHRLLLSKFRTTKDEPLALLWMAFFLIFLFYCQDLVLCFINMKIFSGAIILSCASDNLCLGCVKILITQKSVLQGTSTKITVLEQNYPRYYFFSFFLFSFFFLFLGGFTHSSSIFRELLTCYQIISLISFTGFSCDKITVI